MRPTPLLCLFLLLAAPATGIDVEYPTPGGSVVAVDLLEDAGETIDWRLEVPAAMAEGGCLHGLSSQSDAHLAHATLTRGSDVLRLTLGRNTEHRDTVDEEGEPVRVSTVVFSGSLSVDDPALTTGTWALDLTVRDRQGNPYDCGDDRELRVEADGDDASPAVTFPSAVDGVVHLGAHQSLAPTVTDDTLGRVEYRVDRMPKDTFFLLTPPYVIKSQSFFPGENTLTLRATDRVTGHAATETSVKVLVDGVAPELDVDLLNRTVFYAGVPNPIVLNVTDESDYRVTVSFQGRDLTEDGPGGERTVFRLGVPANATGEDLLQVRVVDAFGNRVSFTRLLTVTQLTTDARVEEVGQDEDERPVVGENVTIHLAMEQPKGIANVTFVLRLDGDVVGEMEVPSRGTNQTTFSVRLPPGRQELTLQAVAPDGVLHDARNLTAKVPVEVYLARVLVGDDAYHVRSTPQGLPDGVLAPNGTVLRTELVERGSSSVYLFKAGNETYHWDPSAPNVQEFKAAEGVDGVDNESPGPGLVLVLALLAAAVALRRR